MKTNVTNLVFVTILLCILSGVTMATDKPILKKTSFEKIPGWAVADNIVSLTAFQQSCQQMTTDNRAFSKNPVYGGSYSDWREVCTIAQNLGSSLSQKQATAFFESNFSALAVHDPILQDGLFTGYFEPVVKGSLTKTNDYQVPVYNRPDDLVVFSKQQEKLAGVRYGRMSNGKPKAYFTRKEIEQGLFNSRNMEIAWLKNRADAFFMQVQGSGRVTLPDGKTLRLAYAGKTGLAYTAIGGILVKNGQLDKKTLSMQTIRKWMDDNPEKSTALMWENKSFVFFRQLPEMDPNLGPVGAQLVNLTPSVSMAIDRRFWAFGTPIWLDTKKGEQSNSTSQNIQSLFVAQDTGSAIRGYARGDVFWGSGPTAGKIAGEMKAKGEMIVLLPNALAAKLLN